MLLYTKELEEKTPVFLELHPSNLCNHACIWCRYNRHNSMLSLEFMLQLLAKYPKVSGVRITGGGEPLTNKDTLPFVEACARKGIKVGLDTNGSLLNAEAIRVLGDHCRYCRVSLDAATPETHAQVHQSRGDFYEILGNIGLLRETRLPELGISYLVTEDNADDIPLLGDLGLPVDYIHFKPLVEGMDSRTRRKALKLIKELQARVNYPLKFDRLIRDLMCNHKVPCRVVDLFRLVSADGREYVCCEHVGEEEFLRQVWDGSNAKCRTCRYNDYNEILDVYVRNSFAKEFL